MGVANKTFARDVESVMKPWGGSQGKLIGLLAHGLEKKTSEAFVLRCVSRRDGKKSFLRRRIAG
ncbi:hypothetical protein HanPI659440_Chr14g0547121 [Helianthus annuus]|nr:hypothetical protein HanPI659440_Chr14g0547121 [Helianthus annuus]